MLKQLISLRRKFEQSLLDFNLPPTQNITVSKNNINTTSTR